MKRLAPAVSPCPIAPHLTDADPNIAAVPPLHGIFCRRRCRRFCRKRFYGEGELYQHMHSAHEQCFLCRRVNPNKFVYYRDYPDLESEWMAAA